MLSPHDPVTPHGPIPGLPKEPEQPILPPDDPHQPDLDREPEGDPPSIEPPVSLPSEKPGITEPPRPRAMRTRSVVFGLAFAVAGTAACDRAETSQAPVTTTSPAGQSTAPSAATLEQRDEALVRVVHAVPAGAPIDVYAGDLAVFESLAFKAGMPYRVVEGKRYVFTARPAGMANAKPLASNTEGLHDGRYYTVFALPGQNHGVHLRVVDDLLTAPAAGRAKLRIVHGGSDAGEVDVVPPGATQALFDGVDFQSVTGYEELDPVNGAIEIRTGGQAATLAKVANATIEAGRFYTLVIVGNARSTPALEAFLIEDAPMPAAHTR
jgi:hypothetical protein